VKLGMNHHFSGDLPILEIFKSTLLTVSTCWASELVKREQHWHYLVQHLEILYGDRRFFGKYTAFINGTR